MKKEYKSKILPSILLVVILFAAALSPCLIASCSADSTYQQYLERFYTLKTSENPASYSVFTINGDTIHAEGNYEQLRVKDFYIEGCENAAKSFRRTGTAYTAEITAECGSPSDNLVVEFSEGLVYRYRIEYDEGWFFGDNHLSGSFSGCIENAIKTDESTAALYISASGNPDEISYALSELTRISNEVTKNIKDDYLKAQALARWVSENIYYDFVARDTSVTLDTISIYNVLKTRRTVCAGYANLYSALLEAVGIKSVNIKGCVVASGYVTYEELPTGTENHEFTAFYCTSQKRWVMVDTVWNSNNSYDKNGYNAGPVHDKYFDATPLALALNHRADKAEQRLYFNSMNYVPEAADETSAAAETIPVTTAAPAESTETSTETEGSENTDAINSNDAFMMAIVMMGVVIAALIILIISTKLAAYLRKKKRAKIREQNKKINNP